MEKAPEGIAVGGNHHDRHSPVDQTLLSPTRLQQQQAVNHELPPPLPYGITASTPPAASPTAPRFVTTTKINNSERLMENGGAAAAHGKAPAHVGGRHLSPPPHPDTGMEAVTGDDDDEVEEEDDDDDIYTDDVGEHDVLPSAAAGTEPETKTAPTVGTGHPQQKPRDEQEGYDEHEVVADKNRQLQKEPTRDVSGYDDTRVEEEENALSGVLAHGSTEEVLHTA
jgi:hypothetical protein